MIGCSCTQYNGKCIIVIKGIISFFAKCLFTRMLREDVYEEHSRRFLYIISWKYRGKDYQCGNTFHGNECGCIMKCGNHKNNGVSIKDLHLK